MRHSPHAGQCGRAFGWGHGVPSSGVWLNELQVGLSLAHHLESSQPSEHTRWSARLGMRIGARLEMDPSQLATLYDVSILTYVGCWVYGKRAGAPSRSRVWSGP